MCTAHLPCTKASSSAQVCAQPLTFGLGGHKILPLYWWLILLARCTTTTFGCAVLCIKIQKCYILYWQLAHFAQTVFLMSLGCCMISLSSGFFHFFYAFSHHFKVNQDIVSLFVCFFNLFSVSLAGFLATES